MSEERDRDAVSVDWAQGDDDVLTAAACRRTRLATFPRVLIVHAKKFQLVNWVPAKLGAW